MIDTMAHVNVSQREQNNKHENGAKQFECKCNSSNIIYAFPSDWTL